MRKLFFRQIFFIITSFFGVSIICFYLLSLTTNTQTQSNIISSLQETTSEESPKHVPKKTNVVQAYFKYLNQVFNGDLGISSSSREPVTSEFLSHLPASIELVFLASLIAVFIGLPLGVFAAIKHRKPTDLIINNLALIAYSIPIFWWGILLILVFSLSLGVTPVAGRLSFLFDIEPVTGFILIDTFISEQPYRMDAFRDAIQHLILPVIVLATLPTAIIARMARQTMIETLSEEYIITAQAKGLSSFRIYWVHGLRNALIPFTNMLGLQVSTLMTGAMLTEYLFAWPGIGKWLLDALDKGDYVSLSGGILITTSLVILINAGVELIQAWLNPSIRIKTRVYNG
ncbi:MAG: peptide ABC transporter permease [Gammaproteobacteria bacterium]|nr:MAG: peptide ABC transporter permease [Gammaproteobacteria bacterium]